MDVRGTVLSDQCPLEVDFPCQPRKYRAYNGYCNNVQNPRWGNANTRYLRFLPPDYFDGNCHFDSHLAHWPNCWLVGRFIAVYANQNDNHFEMVASSVSEESWSNNRVTRANKA